MLFSSSMKMKLIYNYYNNYYYISLPNLDIKLIIIKEIFIKEFKIYNIILTQEIILIKLGIKIKQK